ncbi:MAG: zinc finger Ran-binding domain-containing protein [Pyrinomonadaceae bacterium]
MSGLKCLKCGLMNFAEASNCKRCGAELKSTDEDSLLPFNPHSSKPNASKSVYLQALGLGLLVLVGLFVYSLFRWPRGAGESSFLILTIIYAVLGGWFGSRHRVKAWLLALCLISTYYLSLGYSLYRLLQYNQLYGNWFWTNRFYFSPVIVYASVALAAFLGTRFGAKRSLFRIAPLLSLFVIALIANGYAHDGTGRARQLSYSENITASPPTELAFRLDIKLGVQTKDDPMNFRTLPTAGSIEGGGMNVTVLRKNLTFAPTTQMIMKINGTELQSMMWPVNSPDGSSHLDFSPGANYSDIIKWKVGPDPDLLNSLANAHQIEVTWGNVEIDLPPEQVNALRNFARSWYQILEEEGLLCTNPMCVQGALNPHR